MTKPEKPLNMHPSLGGASARQSGGLRDVVPGAHGKKSGLDLERMCQAFESTNLMAWSYDLDTGRLYLSGAWSCILGGARQPAEIGFDELMRLVPDEEQQRVRDTLAKAALAKDGSRFQFIFQLRKPGGDYMWVKSEGGVVERTPDGLALRIAGINRDISVRRQLKQESALNESRYHAAIETSMDGFWIADNRGCLIEVNDVYVQQSGYSREELIGMQIADLDALDDQHAVLFHREKIRSLGHDRFETLHRRKDGSIWPVEISVSYWPELDQTFTFVMDCTERKRAEREALENRKAHEALHRSQVAAQTAAAFAHELNQPLGAIASYSEAALIMLEAGNINSAKLREAVINCRDQALRAGETIFQMLDLIGTGKVEAEAFNLNGEIRHALKIALKEAELRFQSKLKLEQGLPPVRANRIHVQKVLLNLLFNSVEAMQAAGLPHPSVTISVLTFRDAGLAQVTLQDNGPGISEQEAARLFEPFYSTKHHGMGMGLAISRSLIESNGGQLWCDPGEGPGATFHLTLPFAA